MEINNIREIENLLKFQDKDSFYLAYVVKRVKDNNPWTWRDTENYSYSYFLRNEICIKCYMIKSLVQFYKYFPEIKELCIKCNARAYIVPSQKSLEKLKTLFVNTLFDDDKYNLFFSKDTGILLSQLINPEINNEKIYIIDLDGENSRESYIEFLKNKILEFSDNHENEFRVFDTPNGSELVILHPFDAAGFKAYCVKYSHGFSCNYDNGVLLYSNVKTKYEE